MKTVRTRVKTAFKRNSKGTPATPLASVQLLDASTSTPSILLPKEKPNSTRSLPASPVIRAEKEQSYPGFRLESEPISDPPITPNYKDEQRRHEDEVDISGFAFTGHDPEEIFAGRPIPITIIDNSRHSTPKKRMKSVPRASSDSYFPSPSIESRILTTLPNDDEPVTSDIKFVSPVDPNYLINDVHVSEPSLLEQPQPTDSSYLEISPKEAIPELPSLHEIFAHQAHFRRLDSNIEITRAPSVHNTLDEEKPLLESSLLTAEVDDILDSVWPLPPQTFPSLGWTEHILPSSAYYYSHAATRTVTDIDLRNEKKLSAVTQYLKDQRSPKSDHVDLNEKNRDSDTIRHMRAESTSRIEEGVDLWLRDTNPGFSNNNSEWEFKPMRNWVLHATRAVTFHPPTDRDHSPEDLSDDDRLDLENRYWQYISTHPAHVTLPQSAYDEVLDILAWCYADRVLVPPQPLPVPSPFSQKECWTLLELIRSISAASTPTSSQIVRTRLIAQILLRYTEWRQKYIAKSTPDNILNTPSGKVSTKRVENVLPFRKTFLHLFKSIVCLGIPYIFELKQSSDKDKHASKRSSDEEELGEDPRSRTMNDLILGASQPLIAALLLSASVTLLALPDINGSTRVSALISALCAISSLVAYIITLYGRYHKRSTVSVNSDVYIILASLPLILLAYSLGAFVIGVIAYAIGDSDIARSNGFGRYTAWIIIGVWIALVAVLVTSVAVVKKGL